jgi:hypothetical protein
VTFRLMAFATNDCGILPHLLDFVVPPFRAEASASGVRQKCVFVFDAWNETIYFAAFVRC